jgi:hypothetical protein
MKFNISAFLVAVTLLIGGLSTVISLPVLADDDDDLEGRISSVNRSSQSFVLNGITVYTTNSTEYDDGLRSFSDLAPGQEVEVDFQYQNGKYFATEIELDDDDDDDDDDD